MSGTTTGSSKASITIKAKYGPDFYKRIGQVGGRLGRTGGFGSQLKSKDGLTGRERASEAGRKGGVKSRRKKANVPEPDGWKPWELDDA